MITNSFQIILIAQLIWLFFKDKPLISWGWFIAIYLVYFILELLFDKIGKYMKEHLEG